MKVLGNLAAGRDNNFNLLRFLAAVGVVYTHAIALAVGGIEGEWLYQIIGMTPGKIGVDVFFITSGFLVTASFFTRRHMLSFIWARMLRIYPALIVAVALTLMLGLVFTTWSAEAYLSRAWTWRYGLVNSTLIYEAQFTLPGVFLNVPTAGTVNGSLWTLPHEIRLYIVVAILGALALFGGYLLRRSVDTYIFITMLFFVIAGMVALHVDTEFDPFTHESLRLSTMFFMGALFYAWRNKIVLDVKFALLMFALVCATAFYNADYADTFYRLFLPYWVFCLTYLPAGIIRLFNGYGDYSYGLYIYHWPLMQAIVSLREGIDWPELMVSGLLASLFMAYLSWHFIEKKALSLKTLTSRR